MSGTDLAYAAFSLRPRYAMSGTELAYAATRRQQQRHHRAHPPGSSLRYLPTGMLCNVRYGHTTWSALVAMRFPVWSDPYAGTRPPCRAPEVYLHFSNFPQISATPAQFQPVLVAFLSFSLVSRIPSALFMRLIHASMLPFVRPRLHLCKRAPIYGGSADVSGGGGRSGGGADGGGDPRARGDANSR
eukprot:2046787-Rhodomonas_salina.1